MRHDRAPPSRKGRAVNSNLHDLLRQRLLRRNEQFLHLRRETLAKGRNCVRPPYAVRSNDEHAYDREFLRQIRIADFFSGEPS